MSSSEDVLVYKYDFTSLDFFVCGTNCFIMIKAVKVNFIISLILIICKKSAKSQLGKERLEQMCYAHQSNGSIH